MVLVNTEKIKKPQRIEQTKESRQARLLESKLLIDFNTILEFIRSNFDFKTSDYITQFERIRKLTYSQTYGSIRHYYQEAYILGVDFVNEIFVSSSFLTHSDLDYIVKQSDDFTNRFYGRLFKVLKKGNNEFYKSLFGNVTNPSALINDDEQIQMFAKQLEQAANYLYTSLAINIITEALNAATVQKTKKLLDPQVKPTMFLQAGEATNKMLKELLEEELAEEEAAASEHRISGFFIIPFGITQPQESTKTVRNKLGRVRDATVKYRWVTEEDEKVCLECSLLDGEEFNPLEDSVPDIPSSTHWNCRCRLVIVSSNNDEEDDEEF